MYQLFTVREVRPNLTNSGKRIAPDSSSTTYTMTKFLSPPTPTTPPLPTDSSLVTWSLNPYIEANYIFLVQKEHYETYNLKYLLNLIAPGCKIVQVDGLTDGAACTTLLAKELIDNDAPLVMANSDQFVEWNSNECLYAFSADSIDGGILTFKATHPKWSYAKLDETGFVSEVAEKKVISDEATVGIYYWRHGSDYVKYAEQMISKNIRTNGEFYTCPVFNEAIADGKKVRVKTIDKMWGIGTPEDLNYFLDNHKE
jgi:dTDP-glucose pyrophosphorylase